MLGKYRNDRMTSVINCSWWSGWSRWARVLEVQTPQTICNFPQKDCLRTQKPPVPLFLSQVDSPTRLLNTRTPPWQSTLPQALVFYHSIQCILRILFSSKRKTMEKPSYNLQWLNFQLSLGFGKKKLILASICWFRYFQRQQFNCFGFCEDKVTFEKSNRRILVKI